MKNFKKAFTLIELVFIIVVVGILASVAIPRIERDSLIELADQVEAHIRYTQQLAMMDNVYDADDDEWYKGYWRISFNNTDFNGKGWRYSVYKDSAKKHTGNLNSLDELAIDPQNPQRYLTGGSSSLSSSLNSNNINKKLNLTNTYDIKNISFNKDCGGQVIAFDNKGRPFSAPQSATNPYEKALKENCVITFKNSNNNEIKITIAPETGFITDNRIEAMKTW